MSFWHFFNSHSFGETTQQFWELRVKDYQGESYFRVKNGKPKDNKIKIYITKAVNITKFYHGYYNINLEYCSWIYSEFYYHNYMS